jgi:dimethylglycine dehydrogenase
MGYVEKDHAASDGPFDIEIIGVRRRATRLAEPLFDPRGSRLRA